MTLKHFLQKLPKNDIKGLKINYNLKIKDKEVAGVCYKNSGKNYVFVKNKGYSKAEKKVLLLHEIGHYVWTTSNKDKKKKFRLKRDKLKRKLVKTVIKQKNYKKGTEPFWSEVFAWYYCFTMALKLKKQGYNIL